MTTQELKTQAARLRALQPALTQVQALQTVARVHGYRDWQTAKADLDRGSTGTYLVALTVHDADHPSGRPALNVNDLQRHPGLDAAYSAMRRAVSQQVARLGLTRAGQDERLDVIALETEAINAIAQAQRSNDAAVQVTVPLSTTLGAPDFSVSLHALEDLPCPPAPRRAPDGPVPVFTVASVEEGTEYVDVLPATAIGTDEVVAFVRRTLASAFLHPLSLEDEARLRQECDRCVDAARNPSENHWDCGALQIAPDTVTVVNVVTFLPAQ